MKVKRYMLMALAAMILLVSCASQKPVTPSRLMDASPLAVQEGITDIGGNSIHYLVAGEGEPVVLVHGWVCWGGHWDKTIEVLRKSYRVYAPDLLGHGMSSKPDRDDCYTTDAQADIIAGFIRTVAGKPVYLVGHSMGGEICAKVTLKYPELVNRLVLVDAVGLKKNPEIIPPMARTLRKFDMYGTVATMATETSVKMICRWYMYERTNEVDMHTVRGIMKYTFGTKESCRAFKQISRKGLFYDFIDEEVSGITRPTLLIWGADDLAVPLELGRRYNELIPGSRLVVIQHAGHMVFEEKTPQFTSELCAFIGEK